MVAPSGIRFFHLADDYLLGVDALVAVGQLAERTGSNRRERYRSHLEPVFGSKQIRKISPKLVDDWLDSKYSSGLSLNTITGAFSLLRSILDLAVTRGVLVENPCSRIPKGKRPQAKNRTQPRVLSDSDVGALLSASTPGLRLLFTVYAETGLRRQEMLGLVWDDIDLEAGVIHVRYQLTIAKAGKPARRVALKTGAGDREIPLSSEMVDQLKAHRQEALKFGRHGGSSFVFSTASGLPLHARNVSRAFRLAGDAAGLNREGVEPVSLHDLRHTACSRLIASGLSVVQVQRLAGHANAAITLRLYSHEFARNENREDVRQKMGAGTSTRLSVAGGGS